MRLATHSTGKERFAFFGNSGVWRGALVRAESQRATRLMGCVSTSF